MDKSIGKWKAGVAYGPVLSQTELYLLRCDLELNPILLGKNPGFHLVFNLITGQTSGFNQEARDRDLPFVQKDEPATLPRVKQLFLITEHSPWCTVVQNEHGVTLNDICVQVYQDYSKLILPAEFTTLPARMQEQVKRISLHNEATIQAGTGRWPNGYYPPTPMTVNPEQMKRYDWLRERQYFEGLRKDDNYAMSRLGFKAPDIFIIDIAN